jgi:hypothetical protein
MSITAQDYQRCADLLAHVYLPSVVEPATALRASEVLNDISRLQALLRQAAEEVSEESGGLRAIK